MQSWRYVVCACMFVPMEEEGFSSFVRQARATLDGMRADHRK